MTTLRMHLSGVLRLATSATPASANVAAHGYMGLSEDEALFYDWLEDDSGTVCGIELHILPEHPLTAALRDKAYASFAPFPRIEFRPNVAAHPRGLEAFGDISLQASEDGAWLLAVALDNWLKPSDIDELTRVCGRQVT